MVTVTLPRLQCWPHWANILALLDMFNHIVPAGVSMIRDLRSVVFEHLGIPSSLDVDKRVNYTQRILRGPALEKYKTVLTE